MVKSLSVFVALMGWTLSTTFATTVGPASVRYTITNHTDQRIYSVIQLESADRAFTRADTVDTVNARDGGFLQIYKKHDQFKPYLKLLIQTESRQYSTPVLLYKDRCTAYSIDVTADDLSVEESNFYRIRRGVIAWYIVFLVTFFLRGSALLVFASRYVNRIWLPFVVLNTALVILFQVASKQSIGTLEWRFLGYIILLTSLFEYLVYNSISRQERSMNRILFGIVLGSVLWIFPGYLLILFGQFLFAGC